MKPPLVPIKMTYCDGGKPRELTVMTQKAPGRNLPLPIEHQHAPVSFSLTTLVLFAALTLAVGFFVGAIAMGEATLRLHDSAPAVESEGGRR